MRRLRTAAAAAALCLVAAGCSADADPDRTTAEPPPTEAAESTNHHAEHKADPAGKPLRDQEWFEEIAMPEAYTPSAPYGTGTDDYRCFILDPGLDEDAFITGLDVVPGTEDMVHHVILFRVPPDNVDLAEESDAEDPGQGWTCFGAAGMGSAGNLDAAPWLGAWAPGGGETKMADDVGVPLEQGSRVIMQVHYNLLAPDGPQPDVTAAKLRLAPATKDLASLETMLLPAPVELPCRPGRDDNPLCDRDAAVADVQKRFGADGGQLANTLHLLCGSEPIGPVQFCDRTISEPATIRAVAGHMHLLGKKISIDVNPDKPGEKTVLDIAEWDFDDQGSRPIDPVRLKAGDTVRVTCTHSQEMRDVLPAFEGQPERFVVWGEGTTDEMCLGILLVTRP